jgi:hypothetical protein
MADAQTVKVTLAVGALTALAATGSGLGETNRENTLQEAVKIADRLYELLFSKK